MDQNLPMTYTNTKTSFLLIYSIPKHIPCSFSLCIHYNETYRFEVQLDKLAVAIPPQFCHKRLIVHQHQKKARRLEARFGTPPEFRISS